MTEIKTETGNDIKKTSAPQILSSYQTRRTKDFFEKVQKQLA
jgi:hypothetical protein